jgi:hypothetical protein
MRISVHLLRTVILAGFVALASAAQQRVAPRILSAKSVYFDDQLDVPAVGKKAFAQLKKWGRFQIAPNRNRSDLTIVLSADPPKGSQVMVSGGAHRIRAGLTLLPSTPICQTRQASVNQQ